MFYCVDKVGNICPSVDHRHIVFPLAFLCPMHTSVGGRAVGGPATTYHPPLGAAPPPPASLSFGRCSVALLTLDLWPLLVVVVVVAVEGPCPRAPHTAGFSRRRGPAFVGLSLASLPCSSLWHVISAGPCSSPSLFRLCVLLYTHPTLSLGGRCRPPPNPCYALPNAVSAIPILHLISPSRLPTAHATREAPLPSFPLLLVGGGVVGPCPIY